MISDIFLVEVESFKQIPYSSQKILPTEKFINPADNVIHMEIQRAFKIKVNLSRILSRIKKSNNEKVCEFIKLLSNQYGIELINIGMDFYRNERHERFIIRNCDIIGISMNKLSLEAYFDSEKAADEFSRILKCLLNNCI